MQVWAHRGVSAHAPENTMAAFRLAAELAATSPLVGIELDVHLTRDGVLAVCHDELIDRTSNGRGDIADYTFAELQAFDFSQVEGKDFAAFSPCGCPALAEVLTLAAEAGMQVNIELKTDKNPYPGIEEKVLAAVREAGMAQRVVVSSFNPESVERFLALGSDVPAAQLFYKPMPGLRGKMTEKGWEAIHPRFHLVNPLMVHAAHKRGLKVRVYTVDDPKMARRLAWMGVDAVFSNDPAAVMAALAENGEER